MVSTRLAVLAFAAASIFNGAFALPQGMVEKRAIVTEVVRPIVKVYVVVDQNGNTVSYARSTIYPDVATPIPTPTPTPTPKKVTRKHTVTKTKTYAAPPAETSSTSGGSSGGSTPAPIDSGKLGKGIVYSPYHNDQSCKKPDIVAEEVKKIVDSGNGYNWLRIYGTDCDQVSSVLTAAYENGLKVMLGIYHVDTEANFQSELSTLVAGVKTANQNAGKAADDWSGIIFISVGNEVVNQNPDAADSLVSQLLGYAAVTRSTVRALGYTGSVGNTDVWFYYAKYPQLCGEDKLVMINMHPFFDQNCDVASSGAFLKTHLAEIQAACGADHEVVISETGWPNAGDQMYLSVPGPSQQAQFLELAAANVENYMLLSAYDEGWKPASPSVERHWGILGPSPNN